MAGQMKRSKVWLAFVAGAVLCGAGLAEFTLLRTTQAPALDPRLRVAVDTGNAFSSGNRVTTEPLAPAPPADTSLAELAAWIRPRLCEERWLQIDWVGKLSEAQKLARQCNRLVFLWGSNEPCGRC